MEKRFQRFLSNIQLTSIQRLDARIKYSGVCKKLHDHYYNLKYDGTTKLVIGSYWKRTAIAPPTDVDILFKMPYKEFDRYDSHKGNGQSQLLQDIKTILSTKYPDTDMRGDGQVVVVNFTSYNVEVVPAFSLRNGNYYVPDTHSGGMWKETSPKTELKELINSNKRSNGNTTRLIKMIKAWKYHCNVPIKSFVIELRAINLLKKWKYYNKSSVYYDWMIRDFFRELPDYINGKCKIPGIDEDLYYKDEWESKSKSALERAEKACQFEAQKDVKKATQEWRKIFGDRFNF